MIFKNIPKQLKEKGLPIFWQFYIVFSMTLAILSFFKQESHWLNIILCLLTLNGLLAGFLSHKQKSYPRLLLAYGASLIVLAKLLPSLVYLGLPDYPILPLFIEELGITLVTIFAFIHLLMFEDKFNIKGLIIDYSLLVVSFLFFFLLISPELLNTLIYELSYYQQILFLNVFIGLTLLSMSIVHYFLSKSIALTDGVRIILTILLIIHYAIDALLSFESKTISITLHGLSLSSYRLVGAISILFIFIEKLSLDYSPTAPSRLGNQFLWVASITAIISIPLGLVIRSMMDAPTIDLLLIGIAGSLLSSIVIWRFIILIANTNQQRKRLKAQIQTNALTGLANYQGYLEKMTLSQMTDLLVININIDDFKSINDLYGREVADNILKSLAKRLKQLTKAKIIAHTHSDMFLVVFQTKKANINALINNIQDTLGVWDTVQGKQLTVPLSYGASYCTSTVDPEQLAKQAEQALKTARKQRTSFYLYTEEKENNLLPRHELRDILQQAVDNNYLPVHFQPIYDLKDGSLKALELLIRVESKKHGLLLPGQFLDQAKSYGLLTSLTEVCIKMIAKHYTTLPDVVININLPPYMLKSTKLLNNFINLFEIEKLPPNRFCIEITEDEDIPAKELMHAIYRLKNRGFTIAMDDFGTGYSSLDRLSILSVDTVKIDRSILLTAASGNTAILEWAISLANRLGISSVVEGVETKEQLSLIKLLGADSVQGFLYSKPIHVLQTADIALNSGDISIA